MQIARLVWTLDVDCGSGEDNPGLYKQMLHEDAWRSMYHTENTMQTNIKWQQVNDLV